MKDTIYLTIRNLKGFSDTDLDEILNTLKSLNVRYDNILYKPLQELERKVRIIQSKRQRSKTVLMEFEGTWNGYRSSQDRVVARIYRKIDRSLADRLPSYFSAGFTDGTSNSWHVNKVHRKGKEIKDYQFQVDNFLSEQKQKMEAS